MSTTAELASIDRRISRLRDGMLACYETIEMGRKKLERLEKERRGILSHD